MTIESVDKALDDVRPYLIADGGDVDVVAVENGVVMLQLQVGLVHRHPAALSHACATVASPVRRPCATSPALQCAPAKHPVSSACRATAAPAPRLRPP